MSQDQAPGELPSFDPQGTEQIASIPERFLVGGILGLRASGGWTFRGESIEHAGVCAFLARQLRRTAEGHYWIVNGPQRVFVEIEDAPFFVTMLSVYDDEGDDQGDDDSDQATPVMMLRLNDQSEEPLELKTLFRGPDEVLYAEVKRGEAGAAPGEAHIARFLRTAVMPLEPYLIELDDDGVGVSFGGERVAIPQHSPPSIPAPPSTASASPDDAP